VRAAILDSMQTVVLFPRSGRAQTLADVRKLVVRKYPYLIYHAFDDAADEVVVLAIQHASRDRDYGDA
jgi:plasmid stabilization system protein ParE